MTHKLFSYLRLWWKRIRLIKSMTLDYVDSHCVPVVELVWRWWSSFLWKKEVDLKVVDASA